MGLLDGLKNGYPRYFMYQPAKGIDWGGLLNYQLQKKALAARKPKSTYKLPSLDLKAGDMKPFEGTLKQIQEISGMESTLHQGINALGEQIQEYAVTHGEGFESNPDFIKLTRQYAALKNQLYNIPGMKAQAAQVVGNMNAVRNDVISKGILSSTAILPNREAIFGDAAVGEGPIPYTYDEKGNKVFVPEKVKVTDKNGKEKEINNPEVKGYMSIDDYYNWFDTHVGFRNTPTGIKATPFIAPALYTPGEGWKAMREEMNKASTTFNTTFLSGLGKLTNDAAENNQTIIKLTPDELGNYYTENMSSNIEQLKNSVNLIKNNLTQEQWRQIQSDYYNDIAQDRKVYIYVNPKNGTPSFVAKDVKDVSIDDYVDAKALGLAVPRTSIKQDISALSKQNDNSTPAERKKLNMYEMLFNPQTAKPMTFPLVASYHDPDNPGDNKRTLTFFTGYFNDGGGYASTNLNDDLGIPEKENVEDKPTLMRISRSGVITQWGTILDPNKVPNARVITTTGRVVFAPKSRVNQKGVLEYPTAHKKGNRWVYSETPENFHLKEDEMGWEAQPYVEALVIVPGKDLIDNMTAIIPDTKEYGKQITEAENMWEKSGGDKKNPYFKFKQLADIIKELNGDIDVSISPDAIRQDYNSKIFEIMNDPNIKREDKEKYFGTIGMTFEETPFQKKTLKKYDYFKDSFKELTTVKGSISKKKLITGFNGDLSKIDPDEYYQTTVYIPMSTLIFYDKNTTEENYLRQKKEFSIIYRQKTGKGTPAGRGHLGNSMEGFELPGKQQ